MSSPEAESEAERGEATDAPTDPLERLQHEYITGNITDKEFERKRAVLQQEEGDALSTEDLDPGLISGDVVEAKRDAGDRDAGQNASGDWVTEEAYGGADTEDVTLSNGQRIRVETMEPMQFATLVERHDIGDVEAALNGVDGDVAIDDLEEELDEATALKFVRFARDVIDGRVVKPEGAHWADPQADGFDLTTLEQEDLVTVIATIVQRDPEALQAAAERRQERAKRFRG
jgi:hypothetical protein